MPFALCDGLASIRSLVWFTVRSDYNIVFGCLRLSQKCLTIVGFLIITDQSCCYKACKMIVQDFSNRLGIVDLAAIFFEE